MKKIILTIAFIASGLVASAQVGIGTEDPKATLQVDASAAATEAAGVLVPRVSVATLNTKAAAYGADQNGALVFITAITGAANETSNVTATGFHYYDSASDKWVSVKGAAAAAEPYQNIVGGVQNMDGNGIIASSTYFVIFKGDNAGTLTTPAPVAGKTFWVKNIGLNVASVAGQNVGGGKMRAFVCDGTTWYPQNQ